MSKVRLTKEFVPRLDEIKADENGRKVVRHPSEFMLLDMVDGKSIRCMDGLSEGKHTLEVDRGNSCRTEYQLEITEQRVFILTEYQKPNTTETDVPQSEPEDDVEEESENTPLVESEDFSEEEEEEEEEDEEDESDEDEPEDDESTEEEAVIACQWCWSKTGESKDGRERVDGGVCPICENERDHLYYKPKSD